MPDIESRQVAGNVIGIECRPGKRADDIRNVTGRSRTPKGGIVEIRSEHPHRGAQSFWTRLGLPPAHHLRIEPCCLHGIRPRCAARKGPDDTSPRCLRVAKHGGERHVYEQREMRDWYENELDPA